MGTKQQGQTRHFKTELFVLPIDSKCIAGMERRNRFMAKGNVFSTIDYSSL